jgi:hypothetical protein
MSEKTTILAIHVHENQGVEIEVALEKGNMNAITMIGLLEQIKFDMLKDQMINSIEKKESQYDA